MITILDLKFACEKCVVGHRTANCEHLNRPLIEIKPKGRPVSQCGHCRSKRQTQLVKTHHQCKCGDSEQYETKKRVEFLFTNNVRAMIFGSVTQIQRLYSLIMSNEKRVACSMAKKKNKNLKNNESHLPPSPSPVTLTSADQNRSSTSRNNSSNQSLNDVQLDTLSPRFPSKSPSADETIVDLEFVEMNVVEEIPGTNLSLNNPCKCHINGSCICSELSQKSRKTSRRSSTISSKQSSPPVSRSSQPIYPNTMRPYNSNQSPLDVLIRELEVNQSSVSANSAGAFSTSFDLSAVTSPIYISRTDSSMNNIPQSTAGRCGCASNAQFVQPISSPVGSSCCGGVSRSPNHHAIMYPSQTVITGNVCCGSNLSACQSSKNMQMVMDPHSSSCCCAPRKPSPISKSCCGSKNNYTDNTPVEINTVHSAPFSYPSVTNTRGGCSCNHEINHAPSAPIETPVQSTSCISTQNTNNNGSSCCGGSKSNQLNRIHIPAPIQSICCGKSKSSNDRSHLNNQKVIPTTLHPTSIPLLVNQETSNHASGLMSTASSTKNTDMKNNSTKLNSRTSSSMSLMQLLDSFDPTDPSSNPNAGQTTNECPCPCGSVTNECNQCTTDLCDTGLNNLFNHD